MLVGESTTVRPSDARGWVPDEVGASVAGGVVVALPHQIRVSVRRGVVHDHLGIDVPALVLLTDDRLGRRRVGASGRGADRSAQTVGRRGHPGQEGGVVQDIGGTEAVDLGFPGGAAPGHGNRPGRHGREGVSRRRPMAGRPGQHRDVVPGIAERGRDEQQILALARHQPPAGEILTGRSGDLNGRRIRRAGRRLRAKHRSIGGDGDGRRDNGDAGGHDHGNQGDRNLHRLAAPAPGILPSLLGLPHLIPSALPTAYGHMAVRNVRPPDGVERLDTFRPRDADGSGPTTGARPGNHTSSRGRGAVFRGLSRRFRPGFEPGSGRHWADPDAPG